MKPLRILALTTWILALAPAALAANFGLRAGHYSDMKEEFVGAEVVFDIGAVNINPNIEYSLADNVTAGSANIDVTFDFMKTATVTPYLGAGIGIWYVDDDLGDNTADAVGNVIAGVAFDTGFLKPYAQVKYFRLIQDDGAGNEDDVSFAVGLRF